MEIWTKVTHPLILLPLACGPQRWAEWGHGNRAALGSRFHSRGLGFVTPCEEPNQLSLGCDPSDAPWVHVTYWLAILSLVPWWWGNGPVHTGCAHGSRGDGLWKCRFYLDRSGTGCRGRIPDEAGQSWWSLYRGDMGSGQGIAEAVPRFAHLGFYA